jgi:hypothetical protein
MITESACIRRDHSQVYEYVKDGAPGLVMWTKSLIRDCFRPECNAETAYNRCYCRWARLKDDGLEHRRFQAGE